MSTSEEPQRGKRFLCDGRAIAFAHRGGAIEAPENTLAAFQSAADLGFQYFETDVHLSADGIVVAFHDASIDRATSGSGAIAEMTWDEIRDHLVDGTEPIPSMRELFVAFPDAFFNIDAKSNAVVGPLVELINELEVTDRVCVGSFSTKRLDRVRALASSRLCTSASPGEVLRVWAKAFAGVGSLPTGPKALQIPHTMLGIPITTRKLVEFCHHHGLHVHVWTIDDPVVVGQLLDLGVDGIMTDRPSEVKDVFVERGLWPNRGSEA